MSWVLSRRTTRSHAARALRRRREEAPFIPLRAALPDGVPIYMTPRGLQLLLDERSALEAERAAVDGSEDERRRAQAVGDGRLALQNERIVTARLVEPAPDHDEVRFGSKVTFTHEAGRMKGTTLTFTIVGVDEADMKQGRIAFTAPLARALMGRRKDEVATLQLGAEQQRLRVVRIGLSPLTYGWWPLGSFAPWNASPSTCAANTWN